MGCIEMPSVIVTGQSGGMLVYSGAILSGRGIIPIGGVQLKADTRNSGSIYIGFSGGVTVQSGALVANAGAWSGNGLDGMQLEPGATYFVPAIANAARQGPTSGVANIYAAIDAPASGFNRLYWEIL